MINTINILDAIIKPCFVLVETLVYPPVKAVGLSDNTAQLSFLAQLFKTKRI